MIVLHGWLLLESFILYSVLVACTSNSTEGAIMSSKNSARLFSRFNCFKIMLALLCCDGLIVFQIVQGLQTDHRNLVQTMRDRDQFFREVRLNQHGLELRIVIAP